MKYIKTKNILFFLFFSFFTSCVKDVKLNVASGEKKMVVEGIIENNELPYVSLTKSIGFNDKIDLSNVEYIKGAIVKVFDLNDNTMIQLKEYQIDTTFGNQVFSFNIYAPDVSDPVAMNFKGKQEHTYLLNIDANGINAKAYTKIPTALPLDSLWLEPIPGKEDKFKSLKGLFKDPDTFGNSVRYQTKNNRYIKDSTETERFFDPFSPVYDDAIINGTTFPVTFDLGYDKTKTYSNDEIQEVAFVKKGDTITLKWSSIDRGVYTFWQTLIFSQNSTGNPFSTPIKVQGNVSNALGVWAGYGSVYYTIIDSIK